MTQSDEKQVSRQGEAVVIATTAVKTLFWLLVAVALLAVLFRFVFPAAAMKIYDDIGNVPRAYECARVAVATSDGEKKVNARLSCVNYSISLFSEHPDEYAGEVVKNTEIFLTDEDCVRRIKLIDEYNIASASPSFRPNFYSYAQYLYAENARARYRLSEAKLLYGNEYLDIDDVLVKCSDDIASLEEKAVVLGQVTAVLREMTVDGVNGQGSMDFDVLTAVAEGYVSDVFDGMKETPELRDLYLIKIYEKLVVRLSVGGFVSESELNKLKLVNYGGTSYDISALYDVLLKNYCN